MRVWFVTELYYPETTSTGYFLTRLAEGLAAEGPVSVLCAQPTYSAHGQHAPQRETHHGVDIRRCRSTTFHKDRTAGRLINLLTMSATMFFAALRHFRQNDVAIVVTNPPTLPFVILLAARLRGARFVLLVHDVYPDVLYVVGSLKRNSIVARLAEAVARLPYRWAARVIVLGRDMRALAERKLGGDGGKVVIIPNWADVDEVVPTARDDNELLVTLGLASKWVVQCSGNMGRTHGVEVVMEAARFLRTSSPRVHFLICGSGARFGELQREASAAGSNITVLATRPRSQLNTLLGACDVSLICFRPGMAGVSVPSRMYNVLASGKPIIAVADDHSELACVVRDEDVGWVVPTESVRLLAKAITDAQSDTAANVARGSRARRAAEHNTLQHAIIKYLILVRSLAPGFGQNEVPVPVSTSVSTRRSTNAK
jgi:glycosyltransferase involved in cell wall biosynthesis